MSDNLLGEYKELYAARARKFEGNPKYSNSFQAEKNLSDAMQSCSQLEEFKGKIGNKNEMCAVALVKDECLIEKAFFEKHKEEIRKLAAERILARIHEFDNSMDLVSAVIEEYNKNSIEISMDESHRQLMYDWKMVDLLEVYENAEVPDKYKQQMLESAQEFRESCLRSVESLEKNNDAWQTGWRLNPDLILEYRHKRLLPYKDEHITEQLLKYKSIVNR
ncbi:MAG: hypothetical protein JXR58_03935 [Bacteroidales bacterium]|nr:hypothetical protein [Bacteroidales bacterium]